MSSSLALIALAGSGYAEVARPGRGAPTEGTVSIVDPGGRAMRHFYQRLHAVEHREAGAVARISVYGTSTNGADRVTSQMRNVLQKRFGDAGRGFMVIAPGWRSQQYRDIDWAYNTFRTVVVNRGRSPERRYGLGGVLAMNRGTGSWVTYGTTKRGRSNRVASLFRLFYQAYPDGGDVRLQIDEGPLKQVSTKAATIEDHVAEVRATAGPHRFKVSIGSGAVRLYGAVMENDGPGVVVDGLSLIGASVLMMDNFDGRHLATQVRQRNPDLLVFWLGGNDVPAQRFRREYFVERYGRMIQRARRGRPEASCLVVSVLDKGHHKNGRVRSRVYTRPVVEAQRDVATAQGCAFYNIFDDMGGADTMGRWYRQSPRLVVADYMHLTEAGARHVGDMISRALLAGFSSSR